MVQYDTQLRSWKILNLRIAWATQQVSDQPEIHCEAVSQNKKKMKGKGKLQVFKASKNLYKAGKDKFIHWECEMSL